MKLARLDELGTPGIAGFGVLLFCLSFYVGNIGPARDELTRLKTQAAQLSATARAAGPAVRATVAAPSRPLPPYSSATDTLKELGNIANRHGVTVERTTYGLSSKDGRLRLEINLPLKGIYPALRAFLAEVLALPAAPVLDELTMQRQQASEPMVEANARFSYYFSP